MKLVVLVANDFAAIEILRSRAVLEPAGLYKQARNLAILQAQRERHARRARSDDAHPRLKARSQVVLDVPKQHQSSFDSTHPCRMTTELAPGSRSANGPPATHGNEIRPANRVRR